MGECTDSNGGNFYSEAPTGVDETGTDDRSTPPRSEMALRGRRHLVDHLSSLSIQFGGAGAELGFVDLDGRGVSD
jgi:hypothetical protein